MTPATDVARYRANLRAEIDGAALYRALADAERQSEIAEIYRKLASAEERHAELWKGRLRDAGQPLPDGRPSVRVRLLGWLAHRFGTALVLPMVVTGELHDSEMYDAQPEARAAGLPAEERSHGRVFRRIVQAKRGGLSGEAVARLEGRHRVMGGNALRAAVLGANDGLVSNFSLVMGVSGAMLQQGTVLLTGLAGLLAGAISMALGEWLSVQSSRELYARQIEIERAELEASPEEEQEELALIYQAKGLPAEQARAMAAAIVAEPSTALETLAREELGIDPESLGGSAWVAAGTSFLLFALGAIIPLLSFMFAGGIGAVVASAVLSALALFGIGAGITLFTGQPPLMSALRQAGFGLAAAAVTFGLGKLVGTGLGL